MAGSCLGWQPAIIAGHSFARLLLDICLAADIRETAFHQKLYKQGLVVCLHTEQRVLACAHGKPHCSPWAGSGNLLVTTELCVQLLALVRQATWDSLSFTDGVHAE